MSLNPAHDRHDITVTLSKVALNTMTPNLKTMKKKTKKKTHTTEQYIYLQITLNITWKLTEHCDFSKLRCQCHNYVTEIPLL